MFAVLVTGPPGAGKTVALIALSDALIDQQVAHAAVDVDEVAWAFPYPDLTRRCGHLRDWCASHRPEGHELLLVAEVVESPDHLSDILAAIGADDHLLVRLEAEPATLRQRIIDREPPGWSGLHRLLDEAKQLHVTMAALDEVDLVLDSERLAPAEIADRIRSTRPDRLSPG